jgi:hypothetical protein
MRALVCFTLDGGPVVTAGEDAADATPVIPVAATAIAAARPILRFIDTSSNGPPYSRYTAGGSEVAVG